MSIQKGQVIQSYYNKTLVLCDNRYYLVKGLNTVGSEISFEIDKSIPMPSLMFAIAAMNEEDLDATLDYIQEKWLNKSKKK